jgi:glutamate synthase (NADPH/NADH) large chain
MFARRVNPEMVDLDPMDEEDRRWLLDRVRRHQDETGSALAERLLAQWEAAVEAFVKVMPKDFKRVLEERRLAAANGSDQAEAALAAVNDERG